MTTETAPPKVNTWTAVAVHEGYALYPYEIADLTEEELYDVRIQIVRGSAAPVEHVDDGPRMPGVYDGEDLIFEVSDAESREEFERRFTQASAMADGLNRAGL